MVKKLIIRKGDEEGKYVVVKEEDLTQELYVKKMPGSNYVREVIETTTSSIEGMRDISRRDRG